VVTPLSPGAVLVVSGEGGSRGGPARPELDELLGAQRSAALKRALLARARRWALNVAPGRVRVTAELSAAVDDAWAQAPGGPLFIVWPQLWRWRPEHASAALEDIADGCGVSVGPVFDGGFYLVALAQPAPSLLDLPADAWGSLDAMGSMLAAANEAGLAAGLLRAERGLHRPADVRAALADPLLDPELRSILQG
jgi:glycosyltransferase A (GT-A) superfamily protein (DUF2064 family)